MRCPNCQGVDLKVIDSRAQELCIKRRRACVTCSYRFTTFERVEKRYPMIRKKNGSLEEFDPTKIRVGLHTAFRKRKLSSEEFETLVQKIDFEIASLTASEISSKQLGEMILEKIQQIDMVAYLRFASVYRDVQTIAEFVELLPQKNDESQKREDCESE